MIQPVVAGDPELHRLVLADGKVLEQAHVPIEEGRSVNGRQDGRTVLADCGRRREAIRVDPLMRSQIAPWIASQERVELDTLKENNPLFGTATNTTGHRIMEMAVKFFF